MFVSSVIVVEWLVVPTPLKVLADDMLWYSWFVLLQRHVAASFVVTLSVVLVVPAGSTCPCVGVVIVAADAGSPGGGETGGNDDDDNNNDDDDDDDDTDGCCRCCCGVVGGAGDDGDENTDSGWAGAMVAVAVAVAR